MAIKSEWRIVVTTRERDRDQRFREHLMHKVREISSFLSEANAEYEMHQMLIGAFAAFALFADKQTEEAVHKSELILREQARL
jgi:hypothetical protein